MIQAVTKEALEMREQLDRNLAAYVIEYLAQAMK
jgi:hypothetical protein